MKILILFICLTILHGCIAQSDGGGGPRKRGKFGPRKKILDKAFKTYKKAAKYEQKITQLIKIIEELEQKSEYSKLFFDYQNLVNKLSKYNNGSCFEKAQDAYYVLKNCTSFLPDLCSAPSISLVNASMCLDENASSFVKFLNCANAKKADLQNCFVEIDPEFSPECKNILKKLPKVKSAQNRCLNQFSNCNNFITNMIPSIIDACISNPTEESKTVFMEGDEVIEQTESFDPIANELTLIVPAHGNREATTVIIGESSMVTSYEQYCVLGERPGDHISTVNEKPSTFLNASTLEIVYVFNVVEDEVTDDEKESLSDSFKKLCGGKPIKKSSSVTVEKDTFDKLNIFNGSQISNSPSSNTKRTRRSDKYTQTKCAKTGTGCSFTFVTSTGSSIKVNRHRVYATITCLACSDDLLPPEGLCSCSYIKDDKTYTECCKN